MSEKLYENEYFYILRENATIPWVKIFTQHPFKELSVTFLSLFLGRV